MLSTTLCSSSWVNGGLPFVWRAVVGLGLRGQGRVMRVSRGGQVEWWWRGAGRDLKHKWQTCAWGERSRVAASMRCSDLSCRSALPVGSECIIGYFQFSQLLVVQLSHLFLFALDVLLLNFHFFLGLCINHRLLCLLPVLIDSQLSSDIHWVPPTFVDFYLSFYSEPPLLF